MTKLNRLVLLSALALLVFAASPVFADPCPQTAFLSGPAGCNSIITINANGSISTALGGRGLSPYDGVEDQLVGVINNNAATLNSLTLSGSNIFGFEGDGICGGFGVAGCPGDDGTSATNFDLSYAGLVGVSTTDGSGGSGGMQHFNIVNSDNGTVFFDRGLATGAAAFFSLEEAPSANGFTVGGVNGGAVPEPSSIVLFGSILAGLSMAGLRKRFSKK